MLHPVEVNNYCISRFEAQRCGLCAAAGRSPRRSPASGCGDVLPAGWESSGGADRPLEVSVPLQQPGRLSASQEIVPVPT